MKISVFEYTGRDYILPAMFKATNGSIWLVTFIDKIDGVAKGVLLSQKNGGATLVGCYADNLEISNLTLLPQGTIVKFEQL